MLYSVVGCCEVDKLSSSLLFSRKAIHDVLCQQGDLIYGRPPVSKARRLLREQWVNDWFDTSVVESLLLDVSYYEEASRKKAALDEAFAKCLEVCKQDSSELPCSETYQTTKEAEATCLNCN